MPTLTRTSRLGLTAGAGVLGSALVWAALSLHASAATDGKDTAKAVKPALSVTVIRATPSEWPTRLAANGNIAAWQEALIGSEAGGLRLVEVLADVGDRVKKGQLLARLQDDSVSAEVEQTRASLREAEATLAEAAANAERARQLQESGAMSAQQIAQFVTGEQTAQARVGVLKARLQADQIRLSQTRIVAPDDGAISARAATVGGVVSSGQELFRLIRKDRLEWRADVPSADLQRLRPGMPVSIVTASGRQAQGSLRLIAPNVDPQTRNGLVYVDITQAQDARAGMFARGEFELGKSGALTLPQASVQMRDGFHYVFRLGDDGKVTETRVEVGRRAGDRVEITRGIDAKQQIVATGVGFLVDGDSVRVVPNPTPAAAAQ